MRIVILLALELDVGGAGGGGGKRKIFIEHGLHVSRCFAGRLVTERTVLEFCEDYYI